MKKKFNQIKRYFIKQHMQLCNWMGLAYKSDLKSSHRVIHELIDRMEQGKSFKVLSGNTILEYENLYDTDIIVRGENNVIYRCIIEDGLIRIIGSTMDRDTNHTFIKENTILN